MNKLTSIFLIFLLTTCSVTTNDGSNDTLLGQWMLVYLGGARCNVCATIEFFKEDKGGIILPSMEIVEFKYHLDKNRKILSFEGTEKIFGKDSIFNFRLSEEEGFQNLELKSKYNNWKYILSREVKRQ